jgi:hypothetical protein
MADYAATHGGMERPAAINATEFQSLDGAANAVGGGHGSGEVLTTKQHEDLLAAIAKGRIVSSQAQANRGSHLTQYVVAKLMAEAVVALLEIIHVTHYQGIVLAFPQRSAMVFIKLLLERHAVADLHQWIEPRHFQQPLVHEDEIVIGLPQMGFQRNDALRDTKAHPQLFGVYGLDDKIIRAGGQSLNQVIAAAAPGENDDVGVANLIVLPDARTQLDTR